MILIVPLSKLSLGRKFLHLRKDLPLEPCYWSNGLQLLQLSNWPRVYFGSMLLMQCFFQHDKAFRCLLSVCSLSSFASFFLDMTSAPPIPGAPTGFLRHSRILAFSLKEKVLCHTYGKIAIAQCQCGLGWAVCPLKFTTWHFILQACRASPVSYCFDLT